MHVNPSVTVGKPLLSVETLNIKLLMHVYPSVIVGKPLLSVDPLNIKSLMNVHPSVSLPCVYPVKLVLSPPL